MSATDTTKSAQKEAVLESIRHGASVTDAAEAASCHRSTVYRWIRGDEQFAERYKAARAGMISSVWGEAYRMTQTEHWEATETTEREGVETMAKTKSMVRWPSIPAIELFLRNHDPDFVGHSDQASGFDMTELAKEIAQVGEGHDNPKPEMKPNVA